MFDPVANQSTLSEAASKQLLGPYGVPFAQEQVCASAAEAIEAANAIGYPVVIMQQIGVQHLSVRTTRPLHTQKANMVSICAGQNHKAMLLQS